MGNRKCGVERCPHPVEARGYCHRHYSNLRITGNPIPRKDWPLEARLLDIGWTVTDRGCWEWNGKRRGRTPETSYGLFSAKALGYEDARAHRVMYENFVGPIPDGIQVRHKCDNPPCVNPAHLIIGTALENSRDMVERRRHWRHDRTRCGKGHDLTLPDAITRTGKANCCTRCYRVRQGLSDENVPPRKLKITDEQIPEIRQRRAAGASLKELADCYGVAIGYISNICTGLRRAAA